MTKQAVVRASKIKKFFIKRWFLIALFSVAIFLFGIRLFIKTSSVPATTSKTNNPTPTLVSSTNLNKPVTQFGIMLNNQIIKINIRQDSFDQLPKSLPVYSLSKFVPQTKIDQLINTFGNRSSFFNQKTNEFSFSGSYSLTNKTTITSEEALSLLQSKLISLRLIANGLQPEIRSYQIFGMELQPASDPATADIWKFVYQGKIGQYLLLGLNISNDLVEARVSRQGKLIYLDVFVQSENVAEADTQRLGFDQVIQKLNNGAGELTRILKSQGEQYSPPPKNQIKSVSLDQISTAYYLGISSQTKLSPYFLFKGTLTYQTGESIQCEVILPATQE
jgi:hypothetical protein